MSPARRMYVVLWCSLQKGRINVVRKHPYVIQNRQKTNLCTERIPPSSSAPRAVCHLYEQATWRAQTAPFQMAYNGMYSYPEQHTRRKTVSTRRMTPRYPDSPVRPTFFFTLTDCTYLPTYLPQRSSAQHSSATAAAQRR